MTILVDLSCSIIYEVIIKINMDKQKVVTKILRDKNETNNNTRRT